MHTFQKCHLLFVAAAASALAQGPPLIGIGDSLGEGVQSANSFRLSQPNSYLNRIATQMGVPFAQPLLMTSPKAYTASSRPAKRPGRMCPCRSLPPSQWSC